MFEQGFKNIDDILHKDAGYDVHLARVRQMLASWLTKLERIIDLLVPMDSQEAEVFATVYAAANNLLIDGVVVTDTAILCAAREGWPPDKLKIPESKFRSAIERIRREDRVPYATTKCVSGQQALQ
jgi:hypothetical protein